MEEDNSKLKMTNKFKMEDDKKKAKDEKNSN